MADTKDTKKVGYKKLKDLRRKLTKLTERLVEIYSTDEVIYGCMYLRKYADETMFKTLKEVGLFKVDMLSDIKMVGRLLEDEILDNEFYQLAGIETESGQYLLSDRYIVPIRDITGEVTAWVGWYPDNRKYVTTPTYGFSKNAQFFNVECYRDCWEKQDGVIFLVEGIFDTLALRSLGFAALGNMGIELSPTKADMLLRYKKVIAINDNDIVGQSANKYSGYAKKEKVWYLPPNHCVVLLPDGVKDADDLIRDYECRTELENCKQGTMLVKL